MGGGQRVDNALHALNSTPPPYCARHFSAFSQIHPFPNSSLPPSRGEVRWGVGGRERAASDRCVRRSPPTRTTAGARSLRRTPLLVSPLEGGRDELGRRVSNVISVRTRSLRRAPVGHSAAGAGSVRRPPSSSPPWKSRPSHNPRIRRCRPIGPIWSGCLSHSEIRGCAKVCWKGGEMNCGGGVQRHFCAHEVVAAAPAVHSAAGARSLRRTPLLVSPLEGGRDELGTGAPRRHSCTGTAVGRRRWAASWC